MSMEKYDMNTYGTKDSELQILNDDNNAEVDVNSLKKTQWYEENPQLQKLEMKAMENIYPDAKMGYLPNGQMYWIVHMYPVVCDQKKDWTLLAIYGSDYPQQRWGGSLNFYPVKPNYYEMMQMVNNSNVIPKTIPHILRDSDDQIYLSTQERPDYFESHRLKKETAASRLRFVMRWITFFELGLVDQQTWSRFCGFQISE